MRYGSGERHEFYVITHNLLNFANANRIYYLNAEPYSHAQYQRKLDGLTRLLSQAKPDILAVQELWDENALVDLATALGFTNDNVVAPLASNDPTSIYTKGMGAIGTPNMGIISRYPITSVEILDKLPSNAVIDIADVGTYTHFNRPPLLVTLDINGQALLVLTAHLKSKRPHFLRQEDGTLLEDMNDPNIRVRAKLRSLCMRAAEAAAIRMNVIEKLSKTNTPMILLGDMNDVTMSVTTQLLSETGEVHYDKSMRDVALFDAARIQTQYGWMHDVAYTHIHQGMPEIIDQIFVSEEFLPDSKFSLGQVERVDYFNDHLKWDYQDRPSDHGVVRAKMVLKKR